MKVIERITAWMKDDSVLNNSLCIGYTLKASSHLIMMNEGLYFAGLLRTLLHFDAHGQILQLI